MMLCDRDIRNRCTGDKPMLSPFSEGVNRPGVISYGLSSVGYDLRLANEIWFFDPLSEEIVDPKRFKDQEYLNSIFVRRVIEKDHFVLPAGCYVLGRSVEWIDMPCDLAGECKGKSTYARCQVIVNTTPLEPEWRGYLTIEIGNTGPIPVRIYINEGICQLQFHQPTDIPELTYETKGGRYQDQKGVTPARMKE